MHLYVIAGAGLSAESNLPTFRTGPNATWAGHDLDKVCTHSTFRANFALVHQFYNERRAKLAAPDVEPNAAHRMIVAWQRRYETSVITTNVDDLLERAGCADVLHLHGSLRRMRCEPKGPGAARVATGCGHVWEIGYAPFHAGRDACPACGSTVDPKPDVTFFEEYSPAYADFERLRKRSRLGDAYVVIGMSGAVLLAGRSVDHVINRLSGLKILNNLEPSPYLDHTVFKHRFFEPATTAAGRIDTLLRQHFGR